MRLQLNPMGMPGPGFGLVVLLALLGPALAAVKIGGIIAAGQSRTKELLEEILKERSSNLPTQNRMHPENAYVEANATFGISNIACAQVGQGVSSIVSPCTGIVHTTLDSLAKRLSIPYINTAPDLIDTTASSKTSPEKSITIVMAPSTAKATADLIRKNRWKDIYFIYDKPEGLEELELILSHIPKSEELQVKGVHQVTSNTSAISYLQEVENGAWDVEKHIILGIDVKMAKRVVQHSYTKRRAYYHFVVPRFTVRHFWSEVRTFDQSTVATFQIIEETEFKTMKAMRAGVSTPKNPEDEHINQIAYSGDMEDVTGAFSHERLPHEGDGDEALIEVPQTDLLEEEEALLMDAGQLLSETMVALSAKQPLAAENIFKELSQITASVSCYRSPLEEYPQGLTIADVMRKIHFKGSTGQVRFNDEGRRTGYTLEVMELTSDADMERVGKWSEQEGLTFSNEHERNTKRARLRQELSKSIIISTIIEKPFLFFKNENETNPHIDNVDGYIKDLIVRVMKDIPGRPQFDIHFVKDGKFGYKDSRQASGWNGLIGEILRKDAHIAVAPLTVTSERSKVVHFSQPFMTTAIGAVARNDADDLFNIRTPFTFLRPLDWRIWLLFLGAYVTVAVVLLVINLINLAVATPPPPPVGPPTACRHFYNSLWYAFGMFMSEECNNCRPKSLGSRVIACSWWFFILIILSIYTAQLWINDPFAPTGEKLPRCVRELLYQDRIEYGLIRGSASEDFFVNTDDNEFKAMYKRMLSFNDSVIESYPKAIDRIRNNSNFIVFADSNFIRYTSAQNPCDTIQVGTDLRRGQYAMAMSKHFALSKKIDDIISSLRDEGFLTELEDRWFGAQQLNCPADDPVIAPSFAYGGKKPTAVAKPLEVRRVLGWFIVLGLGLIIALFITICEVYCKKPKKQRTPEEIAERQAAREAKKNRTKGKKDKAEEVETQQLTAHEAPIGNSQMDDAARIGVGMTNAADDATLKKRGLPREMKIDEEYPGGDDGGFRRSELPPIADVEPFTDTDSRDLIQSPTSGQSTTKMPPSNSTGIKPSNQSLPGPTVQSPDKPSQPIQSILTQSQPKITPNPQSKMPISSQPYQPTFQSQSISTKSTIPQMSKAPQVVQMGRSMPQPVANLPPLSQRVPPVQLPPTMAPIKNSTMPPPQTTPTSAPRTPSPAPAGPPIPTSTLPSMSPVGPISPLSPASPASPNSPNALPPLSGLGKLSGDPPPPPSVVNQGPLSRMELEGQPELKSIDRSPTDTPSTPNDDLERIDPILGNLGSLAGLPPPPASIRPTIQNQDSIGYESSEV